MDNSDFVIGNLNYHSPKLGWEGCMHENKGVASIFDLRSNIRKQIMTGT